MIEKRRWPRVTVQWEAAYTSIARRSGAPATRTSATVDLSEGGVRFRASDFIAVGDRLRFTLRPPRGAAVEAVLAPVWVREIPSLSLYEIGGSFEELSFEGRRALKSWTQPEQAKLVLREPSGSFDITD